LTLIPQDRWSRGAAVVILLYGLVAMHFSATHSPPYDDWRHYSSAVHSLHTGDLRPYAVNPPLLRISTALPTVMLGQKNALGVDPQATHDRPEKRVYATFMRQHGDVFESQIKRAKLVSILWSMFGCWGCFWLAGLVAASDTTGFNAKAGFFAAAAWASSPMMIGHAASLAPDVFAATGVVWATLAIGHWMGRLDIAAAAVAGVGMGLAVCTKFSLVVLVPIWAAACLEWGLRRISAAKLAGSFAMALVAGWFTVQTVYGWSEPAFQLGRPSFASTLMAGELLHTDDGVTRTPDPQYGNRFRGTPLASWWIPLPRVLVEGIDRQKADFDAAGWWAYQNGTWSEIGNLNYYGFAWLIKTPLGHLGLTLTALGIWVRHRFGRDRQRPWGVGDAMLVMLGVSAAVAFLVVSAHTKMNEHYRYIIPCFPAAFVLMGLAFGTLASRAGRIAMIGLLFASVISVAVQYPNMISYFNESVGGGRQGYQYLLGSSVDWGQDLNRLRQWRAARDDRKDDDPPIHFALSSPPMQEDVLRLPADSVDFAWISWREPWARVPHQKTLTPGTYVVSASHLMFPLSPYSVFQDDEPVERIGNTHFVFELEETIDAP